MTDTLDAVAAKAIDKLSAGADAVVAKLTALSDKYGPQVVDSALWAIRANGIRDLIFGLGFAGAAVVLCLIAKPMLKSGSAAMASKDALLSMSDGSARVVISALMFVGAGICAISAFSAIADIWTYIAIFEPQLWVAKKLLGL